MTRWRALRLRFAQPIDPCDADMGYVRAAPVESVCDSAAWPASNNKPTAARKPNFDVTLVSPEPYARSLSTLALTLDCEGNRAVP
jgi:hypothetical protein